MRMQWTILILFGLTGYTHGGAPVVDLGGSNFIQIDEEQDIGTILFNFTATDPVSSHMVDVRSGSALTNEYVNFTYTRSANITVMVMSQRRLDREELTPIQLNFNVEDNIGNLVKVKFDIYLKDINDNSPVFHNVPYQWQIPELPYDNSLTFKVNATDKDDGVAGKVAYELKANAQSDSTREEYENTFKIDATTGLVTLLKPLNYSVNSYYQFTVYAKDPSHNSTTDLTIGVLDVQNLPPFFTGIPYRSSIDENIPVGTSVKRVTARDGDTGISNAINYTIVPGEAGGCSGLFRIDPTEGVIYTDRAIDRDTEPLIDGICVLNILADEIEEHPPQWGKTNETADVTISVRDVNDNTPMFGSVTYTAEIQENSALKIPITLLNPTELSVADADAEAANARMDLSLLYPNESVCPDFEVVPARVQKEGSVVIRVNNSQLLDYEQVKTITVLETANATHVATATLMIQVVASETVNDTHVATATVVIRVDDMNDNNPQFLQKDYAFHVLEATANQTAGVINATDADSGEFGSVAYTLNGGNGRFQIDRLSGEVTTTCADDVTCASDLDREVAGVYYMTITATDMNGAPGGRSNSTSLIVTLDDVNDNAPEFTRSSPITVFIDENDDQYIDKPLVTVEATDRDEPFTNNSDVWYTISTVSQSMFNNVTINTTTGQLFLTAAVDFEGLADTGDSHTRTVEVVVEAWDKGEPALSSNITVNIEVQDMNDNAPMFNATNFHGSVFENETSTEDSSAHVGHVFATDADGSDRNKAISYYVISGSSDRFRINSSSGEVSVQLGAKLDRETVPSYNITIYAIDHGSPPRTGSTIIHVDIADVNDELPTFSERTYSHEVKETENGTLITCGADDRDLNDNLTYSIVRVEAEDENERAVDATLVQNYFGIEPSNGTVFVNTPVTDRETAETIRLTLLVEDLNAFNPSPQNDTAVLTITLLDINDNDPEFDRTNYTMHVSENAMNGTRLEPVHATDPDVNRTITYTLQTGSKPTTSFKIQNNTGTIIKDGYIDRETNETVDLVVIATDNGVPQRSSNVVVTIEIIDFNDNAPIFTNNVTEVSVEENSAEDTEVIQMTAEDGDKGPNAEIKFSFSDPNQSDFAINETTGWVTVNGPIDREEVARYTIQVVAMDQPLNVKEQKTSITTITINIDDVNDNAPSFTSTLYTAKIREDANVGSSVITIIAHDADLGINSVITYAFENDTDPAGLFKIDEHTGLVTSNRSLKNYANFYIINVTAHDGGSSPLANSTLLNVTILDVNLNNPVIRNPPPGYLLRVYECTKPGYALWKFNYTDDDHGVNAEADFNITAGSSDDDISPFHMSPEGQLTLVVKLNYTTKQQYQIQVQLTDRGLPPLSSNPVTITVEVLDVNDHLPSFDSENATLHVAENSPNVTYVGTVEAKDPDHNSVSCYEILPGDWSDHFTVGNDSGQIWTRVAFDREVIARASFRLKVRDCSIVSNASDACDADIGNGDQDDVIDEVRVDVIIDDVDDNPPRFVNEEIITGMRRTTEVGTILELKLKDKEYVSDLDSDKHGINAWKFANNGTITAAPGLTVGAESGTAKCKDDRKHIFCIAENGSIINNRFFSEDLSGFFLVPIRVADSAGYDQANLRVYLIGDDQVLKMVLFGQKENVSTRKDEILKLYSRITGHTFVYSGITDHKTPSGQLDTLKTDLFFHVVEPNTHRILYSNEAINMIDGQAGALQEAVRKYSVIEIVPSLQSAPEDDNLERTIYILAAVVAALGVTVVIIVYVAVTTRLKFQNKLKAATVASTESKVMSADNPLFVPNSNKYSKQSNPLLNSELPLSTDVLYDNRSLGSTNSLDENDVGEIRDANSDTVYDAIEEKEVRMNIFEEKSDPNKPEESPLDAALRFHSMQSMSSEATVKSNQEQIAGDTDPEFVTVSGIDSETFIGDLESTEI